MTKEQEYLDKLLEEIDRVKARNGKGVYKIREKLTDSQAIFARDYLKKNTPYRIEFRKCPQCAFEWDIMIIF